MTIQKEVKVLISAVDNYSEGMLGFNTKAFLIIAAVEAIAASMIAASFAAGEFAVQLGGRVWESATDFHDAMYNVQAVAQSFGTTGLEISDILDGLVQKFPITGKAAGDSMQLVAQLGYGSAEELKNMSHAANMLTVATGADLQAAVMGTLAILNSYNLESSEATRIINTLAAASFSSAATIEDFGVALRYAGPITALMGVSVEETVAALASLRDRGLEASQTGTTLRMSLIQLGKETQAKTEVLAKYGLTYDQVNPSIVGLTGIVEAFNGKVISGQDAATLFGVRSVAMAHVVNMGSDAFDKYVASITGTNAAIDAYNMKLVTWNIVQKNLIGNIDLFQKTIAGGMVPEILHLLGTTEHEGLRGVINYMTKLEFMNEGFYTSFRGVITDFTDTLTGTFKEVFHDTEGFYNYLVLIGVFFGENLKLLFDWNALFFKLWVDVTDSLDIVKIALHTINGSFMIVAGTIALIHDVIAGIVNFFKLGFNIILTGVDAIILGVEMMVLKALTNLNKLPFVDFEEDIAGLTIHVEKLKKEFGSNWAEIEWWDTWTDKVAVSFYKTAESIEGMKVPAKAVKEELEHYGTATLRHVQALKEAEKEFDIYAKVQNDSTLTWLERIQQIDSHQQGLGKSTGDYVNELKKLEEPLNKNLDQIIKTNLETQNQKKAVEGIVYTLREDGTKVWTDWGNGVVKAKEEVLDLDKSVNQMTDREFALYSEQFQADLQKVEEDAKRVHEIVKTQIEWRAKVDIEQAKAAAEILKAAFDSVGQSVVATAEASSSMFSDFSSILTSDQYVSSSNKTWMQKQIEQQMEMQAQALAMQEELTMSQVRNLDAKTDHIKNLSQEAMIKVDGNGLKPHLEAMMWEVFEAIQIRATQEGMDKLLLGASLTEV